MIECECADINNADYLFIMKDDNIESIDEIRKDCYLYKDDDNVIDLSWSDNCIFDNDEIKILTNFKQKLCYLLATLHEDTMMINIVKSIIPNIDLVKLPSNRCIKGNNFREWQKKYNFTIEEFLTNKKYLVISDGIWTIHHLMDLGLFNWDDIEFSSVLDY